MPLFAPPSFASISGKPTTLAGYGITDAASLAGLLSSFNNLSAGSAIYCDPAVAEQNCISTGVSSGFTITILGPVRGMRGTYIVYHSGAITISLPAGSLVANAGAGSISLDAASPVDILCWYYDGTNYYWSVVANLT